MSINKTLIVILGPTATGKTAAGIRIATLLSSEIISSDSRQFYKELSIGSAMPSPEELEQCPHHFIGHLSIHQAYNVSAFETDTLRLLEDRFVAHKQMLMVGGSGLYIDAVCKGIDALPDPDPELRKSLKERHCNDGIESLQAELKQLDPEYYNIVDLQNPTRLMRALEVCITTGQTFTSLRGQKKIQRHFNILKIGLELPKEILMEKIRLRTQAMIQLGLESEARALLPFRHLNALKTVGYKEMFQYFDGLYSMDEAIEKIITNTWRYAKRQYTWFRKDPLVNWLRPDDPEFESKVMQVINKK